MPTGVIRVSRVTLEQVCREYKGKANAERVNLPVVGLEHLSPQTLNLLEVVA